MRQPKVFISFWHELVLNEHYLDNQDDGGNDPKCQMSCKGIKMIIGIKEYHVGRSRMARPRSTKDRN